MSGKSIARIARGLGAIGLLTMSLGACASNAAGPQPIGSPSAAASPVQSDPPAAATAILVHSDGLQVVDAEGAVLESVSYFDPIADVVAVISAATRQDPVVEPHSGGIESSPGTYYRWNGLHLSDPESPVAAPPLDPEWHVWVDGATAGSLPVTTADLVGVGQSQPEVEALVPGALDTVTVNGSTVMEGRFEVVQVGTAGETALNHSTFVRLEGAPLIVTLIMAPTPDWGA